jgi:tRNA A37 threonylcarbamoyladenosine modification protein TsaB
MQNLLRIAGTNKITKVAVATGPGSFTGLRTGVAFGLGLAMGLRVPIVPLPSLALLAMRSEEPATAVIEAGRGRFYYRVPGGIPTIGEPADIPVRQPLVGAPGIAVPGHRMKPDNELRPLAEAAEILLRTAQEVPYRNLEIEYMQSFSVKR